MQAIINKNALAENSSERATRVVMVIASILMIVTFTFIVNFPGYIANPISQLTASIKSIANRNYEERLHFERKDEFRELADAFNQMAEKLDEYEHSNLAKILFEKKRIETIINKMVDPIIGLDEKKKILFVNTEALKILAVPESELIGQYAPDVAVRNDLLRNLLSDLMNEGRLESQPIKPLKIFSEGKENYFTKDILKVATIATGERRAMLVGYVLILKNITPYKELDLAKTNFIATISHELKTPLASILMCVQLLEDNRVGDLNKEQHDILNTVREESNRLKRITGELLDMAQVESGNLRLHIESVRPKDIVEYAYKALKFQAEQKHVDIEIDCSDEASSVKADFDKTIWVMTNLLSNAIHYSPENSKVIIQAKHSNGKVVFSISDFGKGIDPDYQDKVFDKFYKIPGSGTMNSGTGLGLAISKEFIQSEGGRIWVESKPGEGSKFSFELSA
jgi:two-component system, NtrC family, sensor histidine kinase KinB